MVSWKPLQLSQFRGIPSKQLELNSVSAPPAGYWTLELTFAVRFWFCCLCNHRQQNQITRTQIPSTGICAVRTTKNVTNNMRDPTTPPPPKIMGMLGFLLLLQPPETQGKNWHHYCNTAAPQIFGLLSAFSSRIGPNVKAPIPISHRLSTKCDNQWNWDSIQVSDYTASTGISTVCANSWQIASFSGIDM